MNNLEATGWDKNFTQGITAAMQMVGINNILKQLELDFLKRFLIRHYGDFRAVDISQAFELACAGKLDLGPEGAKAFENFSCEYVGRILNAYRKFTVQQQAKVKQLPPAPKELTREENRELDMAYCTYLLKEKIKKLKKPLTWPVHKL